MSVLELFGDVDGFRGGTLAQGKEGTLRMTMISNGLTFGTLLRTLRRRQHLTQQGIAEAIGVHRRTLIRREQGDCLPESKALVLELARHFQLDDQETRQLLEASLTALAPYFLVPFPRNPFFTGREEILEALHMQFSVDQAVAGIHASALQGLGGVGKTQIALEYAYRHALDYSAVFWIAAETEESIVASLLHIARVLQLPGRDEPDQRGTIAAVQRWFSTHTQWLLIWDNVEDLSLLDSFLPTTRPGVCLITTRSQMVGTCAQGLELLPMEQEEGVLFLLRRAKALAVDATREQMCQFATQRPSPFAAASELVVVLGGLPLALDQAGAYIEETGCSPADYAQRYEQHHSYLLARRGAARGYHPRTAASLHNLARLFLEHGKYENALQMVQPALLILEQRAGSDNSYLARALETLGVLYQRQRKHEQAEPLFVRALTMQEHLQGPCHPDTARTLHDMAIFRQEQGNVSEALSLAKRALSIRSQARGETHPQTVATQALCTQLLQEQMSVQKKSV